MPQPTRTLLVTSNGAGMGHLTRQLSVALAGGNTIEPHLFSLSIGLPQVMTLGVSGEYCPSYDRKWVVGPEWHGYLRERLIAMVKELEIQVVAFDGVAPYPGLGQARLRLPGVSFVWVRRGMWQPEVNAAQLKKTVTFDVVVEPGDLAGAADRGPTAQRNDATTVPPITMLDVVPRLERSEAARQLRIAADRPTALVTLGSGRLGNIEGPGAVVLEALLDRPEWQICVTKPAVASKRVPVINPDRIVELHDVYPLVRYLNAFDVAISAAGYNAVHEFVPGGIPTLFVPNTSTRTDDQLARARWLADNGLALTALDSDSERLGESVWRLLETGTRDKLIGAMAGLDDAQKGGGAVATAETLLANAGRLMTARQTLAVRLQNADVAARETVKRIIGPDAVAHIRRIRGTTGPEITNERLKVEITKDEEASTHNGTRSLLITDNVSTEMLRRDRPVEHLIAAGGEYRRARRKIITKYYEVVSGEHLLL